MTLHSTCEGQRITIHGNTGVSLDVALGAGSGAPHIVMDNGYAQHVRITEDAQHTRYFWQQLGKQLDEADSEREQPPDADSAE
jgi:hypothetical protein